MAIEHDKTKQTIGKSMPGYIARVLERFNDWAGTRLASTPGIYKAPTYGAKVQSAIIDDTAPLSPKDKTTLQEITGSLLYYARALWHLATQLRRNLFGSKQSTYSNMLGRFQIIALCFTNRKCIS